MTDSQPSSQIVSNEEEFEIKKILKKKFIQHIDEMSQLYLTHMRIDVHSERHSDVKSMKVNAT